jgi:hypothetical protein
MNPTHYLQTEVQNATGQSCIGAADLWEESPPTLSPGTFFPSVWSDQTKEILQSATTLKLTDGRKFVLVDLEKKEIENGGGYYNFQYQA